MAEEFFSVEVAGIKRELPLMEIKPGIKIAILNILGDYEFVNAVSAELAALLANRGIDVLVTAEAKSIPLAHALSSIMELPYVVLRKTHKPYMGDALQSETLSITTGQKQTLFLDERDRRQVAGKRIAIIDDVISTGSTLQGMRPYHGQGGRRGSGGRGDLHRRRPGAMVRYRCLGALACLDGRLTLNHKYRILI